MMNEFPTRLPPGRSSGIGTEGVVGVNVTEYLEMIEQAGVQRAHAAGLPADPSGQGVRAHQEVGAGRGRQGHRRHQAREAATSPWKAARGRTTSAG